MGMWVVMAGPRVRVGMDFNKGFVSLNLSRKSVCGLPFFPMIVAVNILLKVLVDVAAFG